jgi:transcriptional regulator with XRE-family HTH domain
MTPSDFRARRKGLGLTRAAAAEALGMSESQVSKYEAGMKRGTDRVAPMPKYVALACAAIALGLRE